MVRKLGLNEVTNGLYMLDSNSSLIDTIAFGYTLHMMLVESEIYEDNDWYDFSFGINYKIIDSIDDDFVFLTQKELDLTKTWLDWVCRVIIDSEGEHCSDKIIKKFLSNCDDFFSFMKVSEKQELKSKC